MRYLYSTLVWLNSVGLGCYILTLVVLVVETDIFRGGIKSPVLPVPRPLLQFLMITWCCWSVKGQPGVLIQTSRWMKFSILFLCSSVTLTFVSGVDSLVKSSSPRSLLGKWRWRPEPGCQREGKKIKQQLSIMSQMSELPCLFFRNSLLLHKHRVTVRGRSF